MPARGRGRGDVLAQEAVCRGDAKPPGKLIDRLPQFAASEVRRVVLLMFRAGTLVVDSGYPPRYRLS